MQFNSNVTFNAETEIEIVFEMCNAIGEEQSTVATHADTKRNTFIQ